MIKSEKSPPYDIDRVIATMLTLVKLLHIRVGKEIYAKTNKSYGISSLRKKHLKIDGDTIYLRFKGKSKQILNYRLVNSKLANHLKMLLKLSGDRLFQFVDDNKIKIITDTDLNLYIQEYMGKNFTVKDFRTYAANHLFIKNLLNETKKRKPKNQKTIKKNIQKSIAQTAKYLKHTKAISKKSYIMSFAVNLYMNNPKYFADRKDKSVNDVLLELLHKYKFEIMK